MSKEFAIFPGKFSQLLIIIYSMLINFDINN